MPSLRVALVQLNPTVGDLTGNGRQVVEGILRAKAWRADVVVFPEMVITGYPPEDLLLKPTFVDDNLRAVRRLCPVTKGCAALVGFVDRDRAGRLFNAAALLADGRHVASYHKRCLPNYGVFDERRYFTPGTTPLLVHLNGARLGVSICEDLWESWPAQEIRRAGASLIVNLSASPYHAGKSRERQRLFAQRARANRVSVAYCNLVGGQDELVFDGGSLVLNAGGRLLAHASQFHEDLLVVDLELPTGPSRAVPRSSAVVVTGHVRPPPALPPTSSAWLEPLAEVYDALVLGTGDYVRKNGFETVALGLSGGIDSSLTATIAVDALGKDHVVGVMMPSRFSSPQTQDDAKQLGRALGIHVEEISIEPCFHAYLQTLSALFGTRAVDVTEQNLQARIRGNLLMALSNKFGWLVLTTGNKSEMATGYSTLYGDMAGGFAVIKDVPKTLVYQLARFRNEGASQPPIPESVFERAPTAELAPNQTDQDTLPPYDVLDHILKAYVEEDRGIQEIIRRNGLPAETVGQVVRMVDRSEYKRRQGPPGIKITPKAFGKDRRMPITNRYQES
ncbi:MAG: NAD+ synthase [Candidatus Omnitrophica bacterium]|nr:NAD+ synthase [Candidatus Omnitrophota bacterium]